MALASASASAWSKPGSWALEAESQESEPASVMDFPTLATAAATKAPKKKKPQTLSLAEFTTGASNPKPATATRLTHDEMLALPTGPRERSAEELERPRGFGYSSYNSGGSNRNRDESGPRRTGSGPRDNGPSRADEVDDWGKTKKSVAPERRSGGGGFFDSNPTRADDSDSWVSNKRESAPVQSDMRRSGSSNWGFNKERDSSSDTWGKKREEVGTVASSGARPKLVLQPRTLPLASPPVANGSNGDVTPQSEVSKNGSVPVVKSKGSGSNPFGAARPREEVLAEKGQNWRELEEKLESVKVREEKSGFGKKTSAAGNGTTGASHDRTEGAWRKPVNSVDAKPVEPTESPSSEENVEDAAAES
ncbi:Eukaryotic translation initiation factor 4b3 [Rhynchospora pubera]|uniref:Eukaryotic translation initiation factor 4b3 n=1 Tax=Rhynchospora pubera TaxID=906938 RepID=A0AAV8G4U0_9POAL|nr:Eukaryotic translation initiation factor 4b3 [Rhynchospora pubera]